MASMNINRYWIGVSFLALTVAVSSARFAHADDTADAKKRKAAIAAILLAGGDIKVSVTKFTYDNLERLSIDEVNLRKAEVDNALLVHVGNLKEVRRLDLSDAKIDDQGLRSIAHLPLRELWLQNTKITDASAATIAGIKTLDFLQLNATKLSDEFLEKLAGMPELEDLGLRGTRVTSDGMEHLARHPKLKKLDVYHTAVDDVGVAWLIECKSLRHVGLSMTKITDEVFQYLDEMPKLTSADLSANGRVTTDAVLAFEESHPKCDIEWYRK